MHLLPSADFFQSLTFSKNSFRNTIRVSNSLDPDQDRHSVSPDLVWEHSGSVVECLTRYQGAEGWSLTGATVLCPLARHINPSLVLVQPKKTRPDVAESLLTGT